MVTKNYVIYFKIYIHAQGEVTTEKSNNNNKNIHKKTAQISGVFVRSFRFFRLTELLFVLLVYCRIQRIH